MSFLTMTNEINGSIPRMPYDYAATCVNRAVADAYRQSIWSFNTIESNWTSPAWITSGTVSVAQGSNQIQFDPLVATTAINSIGFVPSTVTQRQFRIGVGTIYNIWQYSSASGTVNTSGTAVTFASGINFTGAKPGYLIAINGVVYTISIAGPTNLTLTSSAGTQTGASFQLGGIAILDRNFQEPSANNVSGMSSGGSTSGGYAIFQCYYASPVPDFKAWYRVRDMLNYNDLYTDKPRRYFDEQDPQRTFYYIPTHVAFYQNDQNPSSATYGWPLFEMWGPPTQVLTYQLGIYRKGLPLVNPTDTLPSALGEDCVMAKARTYAYAWAEANPDQAGKSRPNYLQLKRDDEAEFRRQYGKYRMDDRAMVDAFHTRFRRSRRFPGVDPNYNSVTGTASPGAAW